MEAMLHNFPDNSFGTFSDSPEGGPHRTSAPSMSTPPSLLFDYALISSDGSPHYNYLPSQDDPAFNMAVAQMSILMEKSFPVNTDAGGVPSGQTGIAPLSHGAHYQPSEVSDAMWQDLALPQEYVVSDPGMWEVGGYMPNGMDASTPPFVPESQAPSLTLDPLALSLDVNVTPQTQLSYLSPTPSSSTPPSPQYYCFIDLKGIRWYQCTLCRKCIKERFFNFLDHLKTHDHYRELFKCDWPGCNHPPFTRDRNRRRHIEKNHIRPTNPQSVASTTKHNNRQRQRKTDIWWVDVPALFALATLTFPTPAPGPCRI